MELNAARVVVTGAGVISPLGDTPARLQLALCAGRSGVAPIRSFPAEGLGCPLGGEIADFSPQAYLGARNLRPLNRVAQLTVVAAQAALETSGWTEAKRQEEEAGLVLGTMFCSLRTIAEFDRRGLLTSPAYASALDFPNTVINAAAGQTAIWHNLRGINSTIATGATSGLQAIAYAADMIRSRRARALLAGGAEELCFESVQGFFRAGMLCGSRGGEDASRGNHVAIPFDTRRDGFVTGEGAALLMLEDADAASARGAQPLAEVRGHGSSYDCSRGADSAQAIDAIVRALRAALRDAHLAPEEVGCISASANGSVDGDRHEAGALARVFGAHGSLLPVTAIKAMLGETLGASGGLQAVSLVEAMRDGRVPAIPGLESAELPGMDSVFSNGGAHRPGRCGLLSAVGFDGQCCAVVLGPPGADA